MLKKMFSLFSLLGEGSIQKGGVNPGPTTPRPTESILAYPRKPSSPAPAPSGSPPAPGGQNQGDSNSKS